MEDFVYYNNLFDVYSNLLTDKEKEAFRDYYQEDLSLSEIADSKSISRSAVQKMVKTVIEKLSYYEEMLHLYKEHELLRKLLMVDNIEEIKNKIKDIVE
jgi:predicted DNA-binding protein YlxM (UPF0122 family)